MSPYRKSAAVDFNVVQLAVGQPFNLYKDEEGIFNHLIPDINIKYHYWHPYPYDKDPDWYLVPTEWTCNFFAFPAFIEFFAEGDREDAIAKVATQVDVVVDQCPGKRIIMASHHPHIELIPAPDPKTLSFNNIYATLTCGLFAGE